MDKHSRSPDPQGNHIECYSYHSNNIKPIVTQSVTLSCDLIIRIILCVVIDYHNVIQFICWILTLVGLAINNIASYKPVIISGIYMSHRKWQGSMKLWSMTIQIVTLCLYLINVIYANCVFINVTDINAFVH